MGAAGIYVSASDESAPRRLVAATKSGAPAWSVDGRWIAYSVPAECCWTCRVCRPNDDIWLVRADGTGPRTVTRATADDGDPAWFPPS